MLGFSPLASAPLADDAGVASQNVTVLITGIAATSAVGDVLVSVPITVTGVSATGAVGTIAVAGGASALSAGVSATAALGEAAASTVTYAPVTGVSATGIVGTVGVRTATGVQPVGVFATGSVGQVTVWGKVVPSSAPFWRTIDALVDSLELEESTSELLLESGYRIAMEQDEGAAWVSATPPSGDIWRPVAA